MRISSTSRRSVRFVAVGLAASLAVVACSGDDDADSTSESVSAEDDTAELDAAVVRAEEAEAAAEEAEAVAAELADELVVAEAAAAEAEMQLDDVTGTLETLAASETVRADTAEDEVQQFSDLFPIVVESTLSGIELEQEGVWNLSWTEAYCDFDFCPIPLSTSQATFVRTPEDFLRLVVPGVLDAGIFSVDGSLYAIVDSDATSLPACPDGTPRDTRVTMTVYTDNIQVNEDGSREVTGLEGAITLDARTVGDCTGGVAFYGVKMSRP